MQPRVVRRHPDPAARLQRRRRGQLLQRAAIGPPHLPRVLPGDFARLRIRALDQPHPRDPLLDQSRDVLRRAPQIRLHRYRRSLRALRRPPVERQRVVDRRRALHVDLEPQPRRRRSVDQRRQVLKRRVERDRQSQQAGLDRDAHVAARVRQRADQLEVFERRRLGCPQLRHFLAQQRQDRAAARRVQPPARLHRVGNCRARDKARRQRPTNRRALHGAPQALFARQPD